MPTTSNVTTADAVAIVRGFELDNSITLRAVAELDRDELVSLVLKLSALVVLAKRVGVDMPLGASLDRIADTTEPRSN